MGVDWDGLKPEWVRGLRYVLPEDVEAIYVSHDPMHEISGSPEQTGKVVAVSRSGIYLCQLRARVRRGDWWSGETVQWLPLSAVEGVEIQHESGQGKEGEDWSAYEFREVVVSLDRDVEGWDRRLTLPLTDGDYGEKPKAKAAAGVFVRALLESEQENAPSLGRGRGRSC